MNLARVDVPSNQLAMFDCPSELTFQPSFVSFALENGLIRELKARFALAHRRFCLISL